MLHVVNDAGHLGIFSKEIDAPVYARVRQTVHGVKPFAGPKSAVATPVERPACTL
jgi:hypothetical protein